MVEVRINLNGNVERYMNGCGSEKDLSEVINIRGVPVPLICWELIIDAERAANEAKDEYGYTDRQIQPDDYCYAMRGASRQDIESLADRLEQAAGSLRKIAGYGYYD